MRLGIFASPEFYWPPVNSKESILGKVKKKKNETKISQKNKTTKKSMKDIWKDIWQSGVYLFKRYLKRAELDYE